MTICEKNKPKPTFCDDPDTGPGDCELIFLAGDPVPKDAQTFLTL